ncbi:hypothetical protein CDAR_194441 [Caerostris darwini]|uniref:Uncharacterized protein n=1 Tax=Caerostris darwini TaxID=1538125 RepID=A0AAV4TIQ0_9ARAC|nr:hypothetical protein CDAR_194441 [Caerostris darwini]
MDNSLQIDSNSLEIICDIIAGLVQDWRSVCSDMTERTKWLMSAEINNLTYPLCRMKQEEIFNFLRVLVKNREAIEALFQHSSDIQQMIMQNSDNVLLKRIFEDQLRLLDMVRDFGEAHIILMQYDNRLKLHEMSLYL